jgi:sugar phosphate isomerase/epimerase
MHLPALLHSVSYSGSWGQACLSLEQFIDKAAELGFDGVLLMAKRPHLSVLDYGPAECARLRGRLEHSGLEVVSVAGYNNFTADLEHKDIPNVEIQIQHVTELARLTHDLGGKLVRVFTGYESPAGGYNAQWDLIVRALKECSRRAADLDVTIGVQNHHDVGAGFEAQRDLIRAVGEPNCRALFDAWAPALQGTNIVAAAQAMGSLTAHTTIANYRKHPRYRCDPLTVNYSPLPPAVHAVPIDEGFIDYPAFLSALCEGGFRGSVAYEMCSPLADGNGIETLDGYARRFIEFFNNFRRDVGREQR